MHLSRDTKSQEVYHVIVARVGNGIARDEQILSSKRYLTGKNLTDADVLLFTTLIWFDTVCRTHLKTCKKQIADNQNIFGYVRDIYQLPDISTTVDQQHSMKRYLKSRKHVNPPGIFRMA